VTFQPPRRITPLGGTLPGKFAATPLPALRCWENSQKFACESVAVAAKIRYPDVSFSKEPGEKPPAGWAGVGSNQTKAPRFG